MAAPRPRTIRTLSVLSVLLVAVVAAGVVFQSGEHPGSDPGDTAQQQQPPADVGEAGTCAGQPLVAPAGAARHVAHHGRQHRLAEPPGPARASRSRRSTWAGSTWPQRCNHNAIFVHVRPSGDAFWPSQYAPWSEWLTGERDGSRPGLGPDGVHGRRDPRPQPGVPRLVQPVPGQPAGAGRRRRRPQQARARTIRCAQHPDWAVAYPRRHRRQPALLRPGHPGGPRVRRGLDARGGRAATTSTACTSTTSSTRTRSGGQDFPDDAELRRVRRRLHEPGRLAPGQRQHAGPGDERADQGSSSRG